MRRALCDRLYPSDSIVHVERCVIVSSTRGDFDYCIATWLRVSAVYDLNLRLIRRYRNKLLSFRKENIPDDRLHCCTAVISLGMAIRIFDAHLGQERVEKITQKPPSAMYCVVFHNKPCFTVRP